ncbi:MAG: carboxypeptidase regulatory-like domain-containing protein [Gemmatimonadota bacterium]|nr:carboxypeptidase regulatory-like domain-containing protein [Gemmatimonadota bacterium]
MVSSLLGAGVLLCTLQASQATVTGRVSDRHSGLPVSGVVVTLTDLDRSSITDADGRYRFSEVPAGRQHIGVYHLSYTGRTLHALVPAAGVLEIDISLEREPIRVDELSVRSPPRLRGLETPSVEDHADRSLSLAAVRAHPTLAEPDVFGALDGGHVATDPEMPSGLHIHGGAGQHTGFVIDGFPVFNPYHSGGLFSAINPDAVAEISLFSTTPSAALPDALSGVVAARTLEPGDRTGLRGGASTTQARVTVDGPLGTSGAGYVLGARTGFPGPGLSPDEASYVRGGSHDWLAKLRLPAAGGELSLLGFGTRDGFSAAATAGAEGPDAVRNLFEWQGGTLGVAWEGTAGSTGLEIRGWRAATEAEARWTLDPETTANLETDRRDLGFQAQAERRDPLSGSLSRVGFRVERRATRYGLGADEADRSIGLGTAFLEGRRELGAGLSLALRGSVTAGVGPLRVAPGVRLGWIPGGGVTLSASYARQIQHAQSLRNEESLVGAIFPADLFVLAGGPDGVPVATSDIVVVAAEARPADGLRVGVQGYARDFSGLLLVAPAGGEPFATGTPGFVDSSRGGPGFAFGDGSARGLSVDLAAGGARVGVVAAYGIQRVLYRAGAIAYVPEHGATHRLQGGVNMLPGSTWSLRASIDAAFGRRVTAVPGALEWEACNLLDRGCEFGGSPHYGDAALGSTRAPAYARLDLGVRKHFHIRAGGRDAELGLYATVTNVFGRLNVLTYAIDGVDGNLVPIEMRSRAPLVLGVDCRF